MKKIIIALACIFSMFVANYAFADNYVSGYYRSNGTYVHGYWRTDANSTVCDNYSTLGNYNPYTGQWGTLNYGCGGDSYSYSSSAVTTYVPYQDVAGCSIQAPTFDEVNNFNNIYKQELYRDAKCDELKFHVAHATPHERLTAYLQSTQEWKDVRTSNIAGCKFFDRNGNGHAVMVNNTYLAYAGRDPKCDELEKHALWGTSYERLSAYLVQNEYYQIRGKVLLNNAVAQNAKVSLYYTGGDYINTVYTDTEGNFEFYLMPKGNSYYRFKVEINGKEQNYKKWLKAGKDNNFNLNLENN